MDCVLNNNNRNSRLRIRLSLNVNFSFLVILSSCLCLLIQFYSLPYSKTGWISLSNRILLIIWIVVIGIVLFKRMIKPISGEAIYVVLIAVWTVVSWMFAAVSNPASAVDNALRTAGFLMVPIMLGYNWFFKMDPRVKKIVVATMLLAAILFILLYHSNLRNVYQGPYGSVQISAVTLGYSNPNQTAMYTFLCAIGLFTGAAYMQSKYLKVFFFTLGCYIARVMFATESRTTALLFVVFAAMAIYVRKRQIPRFWIHFAYVLPLAYLVLSIVLPLLGQAITFMGESIFTGREEIYDRYFDRLNLLTFFFGDMNFFQYQNLHNGYIAIAASTGVPVCVAYIKLIKSMLLRSCPDLSASVYERIAFVGFLCAIMNTGSEAALLVGGSQYAFLLFCLVILFTKPKAEPKKGDEL